MLNLNTGARFAIGAAITTAALATVAAFMMPAEQPRPITPRLPPPRIVPAAECPPCDTPAPKPKAARKAKPKADAPASEYAPFADYQIKRYRTERVGPTCVVSWSDGHTTRMSVATLPGKPLNVGRALRVSIAAWESHARKKYARKGRRIPRDAVDAARAQLAIPDSAPRPSVLACHFERDGAVIAKFNPVECNRALGTT